ncbi:hypothetical protein M0802_011843 [Mischocyttarus mexicanus]|nr:hypothetical protein M0802_011843 [Mischocyttarus mexicanus]
MSHGVSYKSFYVRSPCRRIGTTAAGELKYTREWPKGSRSVKVVPVTPSEIQFGTAGCVVVQLLRRSMQIAKVEHKHTYILKGKTSGKSRVSFGMGAWLRDTNVLPN